MIYIFTQNYPSTQNKYAMSYVHSRSLTYFAAGLQFKVVSFSAQESYVYENIEVITEKEFKKIINKQEKNLLISHAPNLKNHIRLIYLYKKCFYKIIFVLHGHEVLDTTKIYPPEYPFKKKTRAKKYAIKGYDRLKLKVLKYVINYLTKRNLLDMIFVSQWMKKATFQSLNLDEGKISGNTHIINNNSNKIFSERDYSFKEESSLGDFITIRPLDDSKYAVDLICNLALKEPNYSFHIYGKGEYFKYYEKPVNVEVFNDFIEQKNIPELLDKYRCALMPTRLDAQGVMVCEMATYGIPVITTDLEVCEEMLNDFENVYFWNIDKFSEGGIEEITVFESTSNQKNLRFHDENTTAKEVQLIKKFSTQR